MATESYKIIERTKNQYRYLQKFRKRPKKGAALPIDFFMAIRTMLGEIDFKKPSLQDFVAEVFQQEGVILEVPYQIRQDNGKTYYLDKTLKEWESLYYTVKNTEKQGLDLNKLMREQEKATRDEIVAEVVANVQSNLRQLDPDTETYWQQFKNTTKELLAIVSNTNTIVRRADGFKDFGPVYNAIKRPYDHAISRGYQPGQIGYVAREVKEAKRIKALQGMYTKEEQLAMAKRVTIPGVRRRMSHQKIIMVLLNNGNMGNRQAMLDSGWTEAEIDLVINAASEKDTKFAQAVWDYLDEFWPEIVDSTKRRRNLIPEKVEARPVETAHGTLRGGYFPIMYKNRGATFLSNTGVTDIQKLTETLRFGNFISSMTRHGHTLERTGNPGQELNLDLFDLHRHVQHVIYDLEVGDATIDIAKILNHREVKAAFAGQGQQHLWDQLELWFANIVMGEMHTGEGIEKVFRYLRSGFVVARIGYNLGTILQQPLGLLQSAPLIGKTNTLYGVMSLMTSPLDSLRTVRAMSPMMQQRQATFNVDVKFIRGQLNRGLGRRLSPKESLEFIHDMSFYGLIKLQSFVDHATWIGAKRRGMTLFDGDVAKSSEYADMMVIRTQGSGIFGERTPLERGTYSKRHQQSDVIKSMFPLMSYFFTKLNVANERLRTTNYRNPLSIVDMAVDMGCLFVFEALLSALIVGNWPDDDEDPTGWALKTAAQSVVAGMPVVNWISSEAQGFHGGGAISGVTGDFGNLIVQIGQGEMDAAAVKAAARVVGDVTRLPGTAQAIRVGEGVIRKADGEDVNAMEILLGPRWRGD